MRAHRGGQSCGCVYMRENFEGAVCTYVCMRSKRRRCSTLTAAAVCLCANRRGMCMCRRLRRCSTLLPSHSCGRYVTYTSDTTLMTVVRVLVVIFYSCSGDLQSALWKWKQTRELKEGRRPPGPVTFAEQVTFWKCKLTRQLTETEERDKLSTEKWPKRTKGEHL